MKIKKARMDLNLDVNFLINDAGIGLISQFQSQNLDEIQEMIVLNILTLTKLTFLFLPSLIKDQGKILNVASQAAFEPIPSMAVYGATKAYVLSFTQSLRVELKDTKVRVMALCPGPTETNFFSRAHSSQEKINFKFRTPEEVVSCAIEGMENEKPITIPGYENRFFTFLTHFMPSSLLAKFSQYMVKK